MFTIFILLSCTLAISSFQASDQRSVSATQQLVAADVTRATASTIESELGQALSTAVTAAMYDVGGSGGGCGDVEQLTLEYLNQRISHGWFYPNLDISIPQISDGDLVFEWQPDGSVRVWGYLGAEFRHIYGPIAHGIMLDASPNPRFERMRSIAWNIVGQAESSGALVESYATEGLDVELAKSDTHVTAIVHDVFAGPCAVVSDGMEFVRYIASKEIVLPPPVTSPSPSRSSPSQPPSPQPSEDFVSGLPPSSEVEEVSHVVEVEPGGLNIGRGWDSFLILPPYDGGDSGTALGAIFSGAPRTEAYVSPYQFGKGLFGVSGYVDPWNGEVKPFLVNALSEIFLKRPPWAPEEK